ncbi:phosphoribosylformylglycinamidine synthase [Aquiflexum sp. LQ15W]|uniref:HAEPLYID family protein n=1 Tax=Cognataquiflexum nitidum TaxID=2922272 RepID=UPI001F145C48|nr:HAEPLYID family protein [Cognataquiflexum nitidum]MCH6199230.1 phosphoribosylformylglycinamidine synthase [Cognataquiflexum nitidum]
MKKIYFIVAFLCWAVQYSYSQESKSDSVKLERSIRDSLYLAETEQAKPSEKAKVLHAEPLYIDLIRDLGARKGEKEWNIGMGMTDKRGFDEFETLIEYEWAPIDRLGLEVELPLTIYSGRGQLPTTLERPSNRLESLKVAGQWSFLVSEKAKTSLALGYIHEFELADLNQWGNERLYRGNVFNPFLVAAKRWGRNFHTLVYTGPKIIREFDQATETVFDINTSIHYMISGTRNFLGLEVNKEIQDGKFSAVLRPQMRIGVADNLLIGIVSGIPINRETQGLSSFLRIIYEPGHRPHH